MEANLIALRILSESSLILYLGFPTVLISLLFISLLALRRSIILLMKYGFRIYKVGILNYSDNNLWKKIFKSMKGEK